MKDKIIVITGASRGLGECMARILAEKGAKLVVSARNKEELTRLAEEIKATVVVADVTRESEVKALAEKTISQFGKIDIWINNAGIWMPKALFEDIDMKKAHELFEVNVFGMAYGSQQAIIQMKKQGYGMIVNIVSSSALTGRALISMYSASKHAARGLTDSIRDELKDKNISVIGVYPGGIKTHLFDEKKPEDFKDYMEPQDIAEKIIANLEKETPEPEQILKRQGQVFTR